MFLATAGTRTGLSKSAWRWATTFLFSGVQIGMRFFPYEDTNGGSARSNISTLRDRNHQCLSLPRVAADSRAETVDKNKKKKKKALEIPSLFAGGIDPSDVQTQYILAGRLATGSSSRKKRGC